MARRRGKQHQRLLLIAVLGGAGWYVRSRRLAAAAASTNVARDRPVAPVPGAPAHPGPGHEEAAAVRAVANEPAAGVLSGDTVVAAMPPEGGPPTPATPGRHGGAADR